MPSFSPGGHGSASRRKKERSTIDFFSQITGRHEHGGVTLFRGGVLSALGHRDYALYWTGSMFSNIGNWLQASVLMWVMSTRTGSSSWVAAINLMNYVPVLLFALFAGYLADALNRRKVIIVTQAIQGLSALTLALLTTFGLASNGAILATVAVMGIAFTFGFPAWMSVLPDLVPAKDMLNALALSSAQFNLGRVIGPALGIIILNVWSEAGAFYLNALSFLLIIGAVAMGRVRTPPGHLERGKFKSHLTEGLSYVGGNRWMVMVLVAVGIGSFFGFSSMVLMPSLATNVLHGGSATYSLLLVMMGIGAALGAPAVTWLDRHIPEKSVIKMSLGALGLLLLLLSASRWTWFSCLVAAGIGGSYLMLGSASNTVLQANSERDLRGRVVSIYIMVYVGAFPIGGQLMGWFADWIKSPQYALLISGLCCTAGAAVFYLVPSLIRQAYSIRGAAQPTD